VQYQFGNSLVDTDARQLFRSGVAVHLSPKAFDLLEVLIHERPRALRKQELHRRLWPDSFVSDASLAMLVAEVRAALGETAKAPRYLRTLHRHGYAFQGDIDSAAKPSTSGPAGFWLVTTTGRVPLVAGNNIVGRDPSARVWLDSPSVSRQHARIRIEGDRATVEDLGSKNGTRARDARVTCATLLADGDELLFGSVRTSFRSCSTDRTRTEAESA
jgi:DNA-binding winged helix-turn-helix (wHTH) protein